MQEKKERNKTIVGVRAPSAAATKHTRRFFLSFFSCISFLPDLV